MGERPAKCVRWDKMRTASVEALHIKTFVSCASQREKLLNTWGRVVKVALKGQMSMSLRGRGGT